MTRRPEIGLDSVVVAARGVVSADLGREKALLAMDDGVYYSLNRVGGWIWELLDEPRTVREIADRVVQRYGVDAAECERDLVSLLEKLHRWKLVKVGAAAE